MKPVLDFETQLRTIPVRNAGVSAAPADHDPALLIVKVDLRYRGVWAIAAALFKAKRYRRFALAGLSRELYEKLDGKRRVGDLIDELSATDKLTFLEARALIMSYLKDLMARGLVVIVPDEDTPSGAS